MDMEAGRALRGPVDVNEGECKRSEKYNFDVVKHAGKRRYEREEDGVRGERETYQVRFIIE
jgi:hypothetical protein